MTSDKIDSNMTLASPGMIFEDHGNQTAEKSKDLTSPLDEPSETGSLSNANKQPERSITGLRWFLVCVAIFSANFLYGLDTTIVADIQAAVSENFDNISQLGWLGVGFGLGSTVSILPLGKAFGIFNTKWLFFGCLANFAAASALCGAAPSMNAIIVGRVWAGAGGAGMYLGTLNLITMIATPLEAPFYVGLEGVVYGGGCILGPVIGGLLADSSATWRWASSFSPILNSNCPANTDKAFYLNLVIFAVTVPMYIFALPSLPQQMETPFVNKLKRLDWLGTIFFAAMYACFVLAFTFGGPVWAWKDGRFIALVVLSFVFLVTFAVTQRYAVLTTVADRLFPCDFLIHPQLLLLWILMACGGLALFVSIYYIPLYFLFVHGDTGTEAAVRLLPFICFTISAILVAGYAMPRVGYHMVWYLVSGILLTAGAAAMYTIKQDSPASHTYGFSVLLGLGMTVSVAAYTIAGKYCKPKRLAEVIQFMNISQGQSQMLGLCIASSIFQNKAFQGMKSVLDGQGFSAEEIRAAIAGSQSKVLDSISPELRAQCIDVLVDTVSDIWIMVIVAGAVMVVCSCFLSRRRF